jgi:hypothetical protein
MSRLVSDALQHAASVIQVFSIASIHSCRQSGSKLPLYVEVMHWRLARSGFVHITCPEYPWFVGAYTSRLLLYAWYKLLQTPTLH